MPNCILINVRQCGPANWSIRQCYRWCTLATSSESPNHPNAPRQSTMRSARAPQKHSFAAYQCHKCIALRTPSSAALRWDPPSEFPAPSTGNSVGDWNCYSCCWRNCYYKYCSSWRRSRCYYCSVPSASLRRPSIQHTLHHCRYRIQEYRVILSYFERGEEWEIKIFWLRSICKVVYESK